MLPHCLPFPQGAAAAARLSHSLLHPYSDLSSPLSPGGGGISDAVNAALATAVSRGGGGGIGWSGGGMGSVPASWQPRGLLVSHMAEHR